MNRGMDVALTFQKQEENRSPDGGGFTLHAREARAATEASGIVDLQAAGDASIIQIVDGVIGDAARNRASDVHVEPSEVFFRIRYRIDGMLREAKTYSMELHALFVSRVKIMGALDIAEKRLPQDGRIRYKDNGREIDLRISTLPTIYGEKVVIRLLDKDALRVQLQALGFSERNLTVYQALYRRPYGMLLTVGPTGSGKTTTLYSTLTELNETNRNIVTIEDPVEYRLDGINQVQVNSRSGLTFTLGLRSILRQDPDVMMIGEIRDAETVDIAVRAALTGRLVLSTLHTNDAAGAISRLIDMGAAPFLVASSLLGVLAQRLVRAICPRCREAYVPAESSDEREFLGDCYEPGMVLYRGKGCSNCGGTGYYGRLAIHEALPLTAKLRELTRLRSSTDALREAAIQEGMTSMFRDGMKKAADGRTTVQEVMRVAYASGE